MRRRTLLIGAIAISAVVHCSILFVFALIQWGLIEQEPILIETVFSDERQQEEFSQELDLNTEVSENLNPVAGGAVTGAVGASSGPPISAARIEMSESLQDPEVVANVREFTLPGESLLGENLGTQAVMGETGAVVQGYGAALSRLTRELLRMMHESKVLVVWLFDESESMKDDQKEIADQFHKVYEELGIAVKKDQSLQSESQRAEDQVLLTAINSYGKNLNFLMKKPSSDVEEIREAIGRIGIDETGKENQCAAIRNSIEKYRTMANRQDRRLVLVMVSDESGDDNQFVEEAIQTAKTANSPIYILGRESIFGYKYAHQTWTHKETGLRFWIRMNRGPETAMPEALQWDGFNARDDAYPSGFGPYAQVRLVKESGGVYFILPGDEKRLSGRGKDDKRKFDFLAMREYEPKLKSEREYKVDRAQSPFRTTIANIIAALDPNDRKRNPELSIERHHYRPQKLVEQGKTNFQKAVYALTQTNLAIATLAKAESGRAVEESWRWRAAYDLMRAQMMAYRVRLFQYVLALDQHVKNPPPLTGKDSKGNRHNEWNLRYTKELLPPDPAQVRATKVDLEEIKKQRQQATELYQFVIEEHPGTPWARRARQELNLGFGIKFEEHYRDPRHYDRSVVDKIDVPKL